MTVAQCLIDALLFFSPAALWMSRRVREAREFCCDDVAVARCGDARQYVEALTTLAAVGALNTARPALGAAGPRLITRVRRLLKEDAMPTFRALRAAALVAALIVLTVAGLRVSAASAARVPRFASGPGPAASAGNIPFGYATQQEGSGVEVRGLQWSVDPPVDRVTIKNVSTERIVSLQFVAAVENWSIADRSRAPVRLFASDPIGVSIAPGESHVVTAGALSAAQLEQVAAESGGARLQAFFALQRVGYANGTEWRTTPNPAALSAEAALNMPRPFYSRDLIVRDATRAQTPFGQCYDEKNRGTSHGGLVPIRNEPGHFMRCQNGRWVEDGTVK